MAGGSGKGTPWLQRSRVRRLEVRRGKQAEGYAVLRGEGRWLPSEADFAKAGWSVLRGSKRARLRARVAGSTKGSVSSSWGQGVSGRVTLLVSRGAVTASSLASLDDLLRGGLRNAQGRKRVSTLAELTVAPRGALPLLARGISGEVFSGGERGVLGVLASQGGGALASVPLAGVATGALLAPLASPRVELLRLLESKANAIGGNTGQVAA